MFSQRIFSTSLGYLWILFSVFIGSSGFGIFLAYILELIALLIVYTLYRLIDEKRDKQKYRKHQPVFNVWIAAVPVLAIHFILIRGIVGATDLNEHIIGYKELIYEWELWVGLGIILFGYLFHFSSQPTPKVVDYTRNKFIVGLILFTLTNLVGILFITNIGTPHFFYLILVMVSIRILMEFYLNRKFDLHD